MTLVVCTIAGCANRKVTTVEEVGHLGEKTKGKPNTTITLTATHSYCGGARPPDELLAELSSPKPETNKWMYIRRGTVNDPGLPIIDSAHTNQSGQVSFSLPEGEYLVVFEDKKDMVQYDKFWRAYANGNEHYSAIDRNCLDEWLRHPEFTFTVSGSGENKFELQIHIPCTWDRVPCTSYHGPLPP